MDLKIMLKPRHPWSIKKLFINVGSSMLVLVILSRSVRYSNSNNNNTAEFKGVIFFVNNKEGNEMVLRHRCISD